MGLLGTIILGTPHIEPESDGLEFRRWFSFLQFFPGGPYSHIQSRLSTSGGGKTAFQHFCWSSFEIGVFGGFLKWWVSPTTMGFSY